MWNIHFKQISDEKRRLVSDLSAQQKSKKNIYTKLRANRALSLQYFLSIENFVDECCCPLLFSFHCYFIVFFSFRFCFGDGLE